MAVVKIHQIRTTLDKSIAYIVNPEKTQNGGLVTTYGCAPTPYAPELIANDFFDLQNEADRVRTVGRRPTVLGLHVIQSFKPGEVSADKAHEIGVEFANRITGGEHQYVLATHTDRGHVHNHLIFNPVNEVTLKRYRTPKSCVFELREISNELSREHGLDVITPGDHDDPAPSLGERHAQVRGASTKDTLREKIDQAVAKTSDLIELVGALQQDGVDVTFRGRDMLVRDRATMARALRVWRLGPAYSESNLAARLGQSPVATFTVARRMVKDLNADTLQVSIPNLPGFYLAVPKRQATNHGATWHLHLPEASTTPVINGRGGYEAAFTSERLADWFTPYVDTRIALDSPKAAPRVRGSTDKQRAYFASVDRRVARLADRFDAVNFKALLMQMTPSERVEIEDAIRTRALVAVGAVNGLVLDRDRTTGADRLEVQARIADMSATITHDQRLLKVCEELRAPAKERSTSTPEQSDKPRAKRSRGMRR